MAARPPVHPRELERRAQAKRDRDEEWLADTFTDDELRELPAGMTIARLKQSYYNSPWG